VIRMKIAKYKRLPFLFLLLFGMYFPAFSQTGLAVAKLDTMAMLIGDQVKLDLSGTFPGNARVRWPMFGDTLMAGILVAEKGPIDTTFSQDRKSFTLHQVMRLTSFDSGFYLIPPLQIYFRNGNDTNTQVTQTETLLLKVHTLAVDTTKAIKPIKGPLKVPMTFKEMLPFILLALLVVLIILGVIYYLRKRKKAEPVFQLKPKVGIPPHEIALNALESLRVKKLWQEGRVKEYHSLLTEIIRAYIEGRFSIMALEMTTLEILGSLQHTNEVPGVSLEKLNYLLTLADLVKFAKMHPLPAENDLSLDNAVHFVHETSMKKDQTTPDDGRN
jgi:hypothetical protein